MGEAKRRKPKIIKDKKERGEWAESVFIARASEEGLPASKPWGDSRSFDCVVGRPGKFVAVQVKCTVFKNPEGEGYICSTRSSHKAYRPGSFDYLAAYVIPEDAWYIIPAKEIRGLKSISLCTVEARYEHYREAWNLLRNATGVSEVAVNEEAEDVVPGKSPLKQSLNGTPSTDVTPMSGVVVKRMENAFNFFRRQLEGGPFAPKKTEES